jgi:hypothetical protein
MDFTDFLILKRIVLGVLAFIYEFWEAWNGR